MRELLLILMKKFPDCRCSITIEHRASMRPDSLQMETNDEYWLHINNFEDVRLCKKFFLVSDLTDYVLNLPGVKDLSPLHEPIQGAPGNTLFGRNLNEN